MLLNIVLTPASLPRSQTSGTGPSASCGYCCRLCPNGGRYPGKIRFIEPQGGNCSRRRAPGASSIGTPQERQAIFRVVTVWDCRRVLLEPGPRGQYSEKFRFIEKYWLQDEMESSQCASSGFRCRVITGSLMRLIAETT